MIQVAVLNWFSWNSHGWCGSIHRWILLFLETIGPIEPHIWGKCATKTGFSGLSQMVWEFLREKLENCIWYFIYFVVRRPVPLKMVMPSKNNFSLLFWKILFFFGNVKWKVFKPSMSTRKVNIHVFSQIRFSQFSPKILLFSKNLFYNKIFVT